MTVTGTAYAIVAVAVIVVAAAIWIFLRRSAAGESPAAARPTPGGVPAPPVAEFHIQGSTATVSFDVPLPDGDIDEVLSDSLIREAIEVVREKRHHLPIDDVARVVARGRRGAGWHEVADPWTSRQRRFFLRAAAFSADVDTMP